MNYESIQIANETMCYHLDVIAIKWTHNKYYYKYYLFLLND